MEIIIDGVRYNVKEGSKPFKKIVALLKSMEYWNNLKKDYNTELNRIKDEEKLLLIEKNKAYKDFCNVEVLPFESLTKTEDILQNVANLKEKERLRLITKNYESKFYKINDLKNRIKFLSTKVVEIIK